MKFCYLGLFHKWKLEALDNSCSTDYGNNLIEHHFVRFYSCYRCGKRKTKILNKPVTNHSVLKTNCLNWKETGTIPTSAKRVQ